MRQNYKIDIDNVPTVPQIEAEFEVVCAQVAAFKPTPELMRAIFEEVVYRINRRISFKINVVPTPMGLDGRHVSSQGTDWAEIMNQRSREY